MHMSTAGKAPDMGTYQGKDMYELADMLTVATSSEDQAWANAVRQAMRSRPEAERRAYERNGVPG